MKKSLSVVHWEQPSMFKFALKIHFIAKTKYRYLKLKHIAGIIFSFIKLSLFQAAYADWIYQL